MDGKLRQREIWEQLNSRQAELNAALIALHCVRELCQLRAETAQSVLSGSFWYKEFGLARLTVPSNPLKVVSLTQQKAVPLLERLIQLLEESKQSSFSPSTYCQRISGTSAGLSTKQTFGLETCSRAWTESVPVVKGISTQSLRDPMKAQPQDQDSKGLGVPQPSPPHSQTAHRTTAISDIHSQEGQPMKESVQPSHVCVPTLSEEEWDKLLELSPLFQLLKGVERKLRGLARDAGLLRGELDGRGTSFIDYLDAQWECEGELLHLDPDSLNPREFLVYQHGLFLLQTLHTLKLTPAVSLQIATSLPSNNYKYNAFRNSFFYQEAEQTVFVRRQRLQSVGGFSLLLLHCLSHIAVGDMSVDSSPIFQRTFFKLLQACLGELFQARLGSSSMGREDAAPQSSMPWDSHPSSSHPTSLLERLQRPSRGLLSQEEVEGLLQKHREASVFLHVERLLREKSLGLRNMEVRHKAQEENSDLAQ
ncbi:uncharacterized protein si:dkey-103g5.4 [Coregonus clupeaformis]|uniref:uncharacterized protein si:dkey-103g5.4 n=1 Tax=Coregonus clupeaformis TaxID=59861 RepID=UPI001E1C353B|nr:uncharacterized protein si:dkey-103g5.4 [Coregonus clupeaformis]